MKTRHLLAITAGVALAACVLTLSSLGTAATVQTRAVPSEAAALEVESKIQAITEADSQSPRSRETVQVSELELESYVLYGMADQLAVRIDTVDLEISPGQLAVTADMFVDRELTSASPVAGRLFEGWHSVFFEGAFEATSGRGRFDLQRVRVDGITVPVFLVKALLESLDEPIDLDAPFETPIGIDEVVLIDRGVSVTY